MNTQEERDTVLEKAGAYWIYYRSDSNKFMTHLPTSAEDEGGWSDDEKDALIFENIVEAMNVVNNYPQITGDHLHMYTRTK